MTPTSRPPDDDDIRREADDTDLALYALGALDDTELRTVETRLATDAASAAAEGRLRHAAGALAASTPAIDTRPPVGLRDRVLAAARAERAPSTTDLVPASPTELHRIESELLTGLIRTLRADEWEAPVDPPEFAGWSVRDLVAHVAAVEAFAADSLARAEPGDADDPLTNEEHTRRAIERHRELTPAAAIAELERYLDAVADRVERLDDLEGTVRWWAGDLTVGQMLTIRAFELWTHAADIARATGRPEPVPAAPSLRTMSTLAVALTPTMCAITGALDSIDADADADAGAPRWVRFELTGPGGATHDVSLDLERAVPTTGPPPVTLTIDIVDYCRAVAKRIGPDELAHRLVGDATVAAAIIASLPALAVL